MINCDSCPIIPDQKDCLECIRNHTNLLEKRIADLETVNQMNGLTESCYNKITDLKGDCCEHNNEVCCFDHSESDFIPCPFCDDNFCQRCDPCLAKALQEIKRLEKENSELKAYKRSSHDQTVKLSTKE